MRSMNACSLARETPHQSDSIAPTSAPESEKPFDEIEPRRARGNEMEMDARMSQQPPLNRGMLMRGVVSADGMPDRAC